jgi:hypothetical protein
LYVYAASQLCWPEWVLITCVLKLVASFPLVPTQLQEYAAQQARKAAAASAAASAAATAAVHRVQAQQRVRAQG